MSENGATLSEMGAEIIASSVPGAGPIIKRALGAVRREWARNTSTALRAAGRESGMTREEIAEQLDDDPRLIPLYVKVVYAAGMNGHDATLRAMGVALGRAARAARDRQCDELLDAEEALNAMRDFGPRHFAVMADMSVLVPGVHSSGALSYAEHMPGRIAERVGLPTRTVKQTILNLASAGVLEDSEADMFSGTAYVMSELGYAVMAAVDAAHPRQSEPVDSP